MANTFKNAVSAAVGTAQTSVYTVPSATTTTVIGLTVANITSSEITVDVVVTDTSATTTVHLVKGAAVPVGGALVPVGGDQKVVLEATDIIKVTSSASSSADVIVSVLEQTQEEVTNLAQVKAFASADYATAAQGTKADAALPKAGGAVTGAITTNSTFDGVDIATRDAVLTATTTTANAALPKAGGAVTGAITTNSTFDGVDIATRDGVLTSTTTTANAALPKVGGTLTGALLGTSATFSGDVVLNALTSIKVPVGTTAQRPSGANGMLRYNSTDAQFEGYADGAWGAIAGGGGDTQTVTTTSVTQTALGSYAKATSLGIEITVIATDTVATERTITKLLVTHDGTTAVATQYGEVNTATAMASYDVDISGSNIRLLATAASTNSTNFTAVATILA